MANEARPQTTRMDTSKLPLPSCLGAILLSEYRRMLLAEGLAVDGERSDEGDNHYYRASRPWRPRSSGYGFLPVSWSRRTTKGEPSPFDRPGSLARSNSASRFSRPGRLTSAPPPSSRPGSGGGSVTGGGLSRAVRKR